MKKLILLLMVMCLLPLGVFADGGSTDPEAELEELRAYCAMLEAENANLTASYVMMETEIAQLQMTINEYAAAIVSREDCIAELEALLSEYAAALHSMTAQPVKSTSLEEQLESFFYFWRVNSDESMLALCAPSWRSSVANPELALFQIIANRTPENDLVIVSVSGSDTDTMRVARANVTIDANNGREPQRYAFHIYMLQEDGVWYLDPQSLALR